MAAPLEIQIDSKRLQKILAASPKELYKALKSAARDIGRRFLSHHRAKRMSGPLGQRVLATKKGLKSHFKYDVSGTTLNSLKVEMGTRSRVAIEHEKGRKLRAKGTAYMTIPMPAAKTAKGRTTKRAKKLLMNAKHVHQAPQAGFGLRHKGRRVKDKLFLIRARDGRKYLATAKTGAKSKGKQLITLWFHLKKSAQLRPLLDFEGLWETWRKKQGRRRWNGAVRGALKAARRKSA